jgi:LuxR family maltose regulon positive regulatory protein
VLRPSEAVVSGADLPAPIEALTDREMEVLRALGRGLSNKEIARVLGLSSFTVRFHASNLYAKLHVNTRAQAVERATLIGLLPRNIGGQSGHVRGLRS